METTKKTTRRTRSNISSPHTEEILEARGKIYGPFAFHANLTQELKETCLRFERIKFEREGNESNKTTQIEWEGLEMILHKIGRIINGNPHYKDSWDDIAGYATLVAKELKGLAING